jgi:hypothetical protein
VDQGFMYVDVILLCTFDDVNSPSVHLSRLWNMSLPALVSLAELIKVSNCQCSMPVLVEWFVFKCRQQVTIVACMLAAGIVVMNNFAANLV